MKDLDANEKDDGTETADRPVRDHVKKPPDPNSSRDSSKKPVDQTTKKKYFYRKPETKVSYIEEVDDELCQVAVVQPEEDSCESEREFFQGDPDFPCAEEDWLPHDDDEPEYDYRQVQQAMRQEQTPPEPLNAFTPNPQFMPTVKPQQAEQRPAEGNICHSYFIDGTCPKGDACYYASTHDPRTREAVFRAKFPDGRIPNRSSPAHSPPARTPPRPPTPNRSVLRRPNDPK
jgi:hypothetical protein